MPKIEAATVVEHREMRHRALIDNAVHLFLDQGAEAVSPAAVAAATGLARSSVYQYFSTSGQLVAAVVEELFSRHITEVVAATAAAGPGAKGRLAAYIKVSLQSAQRNHASKAMSTDLPAQCRAGLAALHLQLVDPLRAIISDCGVADVEMTTSLAMGTVQGAVRLVDQGADPAAVAGFTLTFLEGALDCQGDTCCG